MYLPSACMTSYLHLVYLSVYLFTYYTRPNHLQRHTLVSITLLQLVTHIHVGTAAFAGSVVLLTPAALLALTRNWYMLQLGASVRKV